MKTILLLPLAVVAACQRPPRPPGTDPRPIRSTLSALGATATEVPAVRFIYGKTSCRWAGPNPVVVPQRLPRVGEPLVVRWQLSVIPPPPTTTNADGEVLTPEVSLLVSTRSMDAPLPAGDVAPGCWLLVNPDHVIVPAAESWLTYDRPNGVVTMRWTPVAGQEGLDLYTQLLVLMPGANPLGLISSAGLHLRIGSAP